MNNQYLTEVTRLIKRSHPKLFTIDQLEFKNCFGAVVGYVGGHIFISCGRFGVALKLPKETLDELFQEKGVEHLKYFPKGHIKKEYAVLPQRIIKNRRRFNELVDESIKYAQKVE